MSSRAKMGFSFASVLGIVVVRCSSSRFNLDATRESSSTRHDSREQRQRIYDDPNAYVRYPPTYKQISEQSVSPGNHTGVSRYDTAQLN